jgi:hypothetical protein
LSESGYGSSALNGDHISAFPGDTASITAAPVSEPTPMQEFCDPQVLFTGQGFLRANPAPLVNPTPHQFETDQMARILDPIQFPVQETLAEGFSAAQLPPRAGRIVPSPGSIPYGAQSSDATGSGVQKRVFGVAPSPRPLPPAKRSKTGPLSEKEKKERQEMNIRGVCVRCRVLKDKVYGTTNRGEIAFDPVSLPVFLVLSSDALSSL